ncbi:MAG: family oxidoreductase [Alphaproteobacteria bacterium]|nr:family oxidoreductase [Alphaproteobacteria bacterium]
MTGQPVTLVTGASAGLGAEFARQCRARGDRLALVARRRERLDALAAELGEAHVFAVDLAEPGAPARLMAEVEALGLSVETLINNAGFGLAGRFADLPAERQTEMIELDVRALTELCRLAVPAMLQRRRGFILNVASTAAFQAGPMMAVYYASKAYVLSLTEALHQEAKGSGVHVTALCPGPIATEFFEVAGAADGRLAKLGADPADIARAGLAGLARNRAIVIPGLMNKLTAQSNRLLPRAAMRRIVAAIKS